MRRRGSEVRRIFKVIRIYERIFKVIRIYDALAANDGGGGRIITNAALPTIEDARKRATLFNITNLHSVKNLVVSNRCWVRKRLS